MRENVIEPVGVGFEALLQTVATADIEDIDRAKKEAPAVESEGKSKDDESYKSSK